MVFVVILLAMGSRVRAQVPAPPSPTTPPAPPEANENLPPTSAREAQLEERLRRLEDMNRRILQQYEEMDRRHGERYERLSREFRILQERVQEEVTGAQGAAPATGMGPRRGPASFPTT
jgi:hypothetical protein